MTERRSGGRAAGAASPILLHPVALDAHCIDWLDVPGLSAPTLPGHGDRVRARPGLTLDDMADEVVGWTSGPLDVVGASLGGMVALHLALNHPDRVRSLVLACTTARTDTDTMEARAAATEERGAPRMVDDAMARWFTEEALQRTPAPAPLEYARRCLGRMDTGALADTWRAVARHDVSARLGEIPVPTTCIAGPRDVSTPSAVMAEVAAGLPQARLVELDAPHMAHLERPAEFSEAVRSHLQWVEEVLG